MNIIATNNSNIIINTLNQQNGGACSEQAFQNILTAYQNTLNSNETLLQKLLEYAAENRRLKTELYLLRAATTCVNNLPIADAK